MSVAISEFKTSFRTRMRYLLASLGVATPAETVSGIIAFYIVDVMNLPATWFATFWFFYTIYNAFNNPAFGYDTLLEIQPDSVELGFCLFLTIPTSIGFLLAIFLLWLYPLHGRRLKEIRSVLAARIGQPQDQTTGLSEPASEIE